MVDDCCQLRVGVVLHDLHHLRVRVAAAAGCDVADLPQQVPVVLAREHREELLVAALAMLAVAAHAIAAVELLAKQNAKRNRLLSALVALIAVIMGVLINRL